MIYSHHVIAHPLVKIRFVCVKINSTANRIGDIAYGGLVEADSKSLPVSKILDSIFQSAYAPHHWNGSVPKRIHLIEPARFNAAWHQQKVRTGIHLVT